MQDYEFQSGKPAGFHEQKKKNASLPMIIKEEGIKRKKEKRIKFSRGLPLFLTISSTFFKKERLKYSALRHLQEVFVARVMCIVHGLKASMREVIFTH